MCKQLKETGSWDNSKSFLLGLHGTKIITYKTTK